MRIVVIEDELKTKNGIIKLLAKINSSYEVVGDARNGADGIEVILSTNPDVVITDIRMPKMDGLEMIRYLKEKDIKSRIIIISGHSDFQYAQKAVKLGTCDYLLKPITIDDLSASLNNVEKLLSKENDLMAHKRSNARLPEELLYRIFTTSCEDPESYISEFTESIGECNTSKYCLAVYKWTKSKAVSTRREITSSIKEIINDHDNIKYFITELNESREVVVVFFNKNREVIEKYLEKTLESLHSRGIWEYNIGLAEFYDIHDITTALKSVREDLKWSIVFEEDYIISHERIFGMQVSQFAYPDKIEERIVNSIHTSNVGLIDIYLDDFIKALKREVYYPDEIHEAIIRLVNVVLYCIRQTNSDLYQQLKQMEIVDWIKECNSLNKIKNMLGNLVSQISSYKSDKNENTYSLVVKKALSIIEKEYSKDLSLEEIAGRLNITPEYLSCLFNKEVGKRFISYITDCRIEKAKILLKNRNIKIYEIAAMIGYTDAQYFCKVFKKVTGISTGEYLRIQQ